MRVSRRSYHEVDSDLDLLDLSLFAIVVGYGGRYIVLDLWI